jgi:AraC family transcriptional regulator, transcriptional activator of pobA
MLEIKSLHQLEKPSKPERVLKYILVLCKQGNATIVIDENEFALNENQVITITSGQIHFFKNIDGQIDIIELIFHNGLFCHFGMNEVITLKTNTANDLFLKIETELKTKPYQYLISTHNYIELILIELNRAKVENGDEIWKPEALFLKFLEMVRTHFSESYTLANFSEKLQTTEAKLNELSKLYTNKTAQNVIFSLTVSEAKRMLIYQNLSIKEVAYQLGFNDPFYFSNFFKKHTLISPKEYKKKFEI